MSEYEYTDKDGDTLRVYPHFGAVYLQNHETGTGPASVAVAVEDAPAVALAILRAADTPDNHADVHCAISSLIEHEHTRTRQAEREAEDAKVREFFIAMNPGWIIGNGVDVQVSDKVREQYRAALEFFTREDAGPACTRTIANVEYLGPEHRASEWRDSAGCLWAYVHGGWRWRSGVGAPYHLSEPESFPWTEVLP